MDTRVNRPLAAFVVAASFVLSISTSAQEAGHGPSAVLTEIQDSYIFVFGPSVAARDVNFRAEAMVNAAGGRMRFVYRSAIRGFSAHMSAGAAARLFDSNPEIAYFEHDGLVSIVGQERGIGGSKKPSGTPGGGGGGGDTVADSQVVPWGITRVGGGATYTGTGTAWIIDTGIDFDHKDLNVDIERSANFVFRGKNSAKDGNGHGTHVAGTIAAKDNAQDVIGVAPGATVVAVRVLDNSGSGSISGVVAGVDYVAAKGSDGDVANMSLGGSGHWKSLHDAIVNAASGANGNDPIKFSLAAGNSAADAEGFEPAHIEATNVYTISAIDVNDVFAWFSNWGNPPIDYAAPGVDVLSTKKGGGTTTFSGTSMAAPHVAGLLLLGAISTDLTAKGDDEDGSPDRIADPIAHSSN